MKKIIFCILTAGVIFAGTSNLTVPSCMDNGDGTATFDIYIQNDVDIYGFQFLIDPGANLTGFDGWASGGLAADQGFSVQLGANNGMVLGFSFNGASIPAQSEPALLTSIPYSVADGVDACSLPMDLFVATAGEEVEVWGTAFMFTGHIFSSFACSDGTSMNADDCEAAGGTWEIYDTDLTWNGDSVLRIHDNLNEAAQFSLGENYPNPFNPSTVISYNVTVASDVSLVVYNMRGQEIITLASGSHLPNQYSVEWNGQDANGLEMPAGMYIYKLVSDNFVQSKKMLFVK